MEKFLHASKVEPKNILSPSVTIRLVYSPDLNKSDTRDGMIAQLQINIHPLIWAKVSDQLWQWFVSHNIHIKPRQCYLQRREQEEIKGYAQQIPESSSSVYLCRRLRANYKLNNFPPTGTPNSKKKKNLKKQKKDRQTWHDSETQHKNSHVYIHCTLLYTP